MKKSKDEIQEQKSITADKLAKIPSWIIILLLKYWAAAAAIFFSVIGGSDIGIKFDEVTEGTTADIFAQDIRLIVMIGLFLALFTNYLIRPAIRMMNSRQNKVFRYNMINMKGFISFILALLYNMTLSIILYFFVYYFGMKGWIYNPFGTTSYGIEPFSYGLFYIIFDFIFLFIKDVILDIAARVKYKRLATREVPEYDV